MDSNANKFEGLQAQRLTGSIRMLKCDRSGSNNGAYSGAFPCKYKRFGRVFGNALGAISNRIQWRTQELIRIDFKSTLDMGWPAGGRVRSGRNSTICQHP